jgi:hypothetical protein
MNWRKLNRVLHRDFGYFFAATSIIYGLSGIALNHIKDWNPSYVVNTKTIQVHDLPSREDITRNYVLAFLGRINETDNFKKYYFPKDNRLKIFLDGGSVVINLDNGEGVIEKLRRRKVFHDMNYLHYNPGKWWMWFSDIYAGALILLSVTGLFILRGKNGIKGRGAWLTLAGLIVPLIILYFIL